MSDTARFKIAYSVAHLGKIGLWEPGELYFAIFLTEVCGFAPLSMAICLGGSMAANFLADMAVGFGLHRRLSTPLQAARLQMAGAICCTIGMLLFALTPWIPKNWEFAYAAFALICFWGSYSLLDQPQNVMLALNTASDRDRSQLVALRNVSGGLARVILASAFAPPFYTIAEPSSGRSFPGAGRGAGRRGDLRSSHASDELSSNLRRWHGE
jgi:Na+/melibiose symporter-like transporter